MPDLPSIRSRALISCFVLLLVSTSVASAGTEHSVCPSGCDFTTLASAVSAASSGDMVLLDVRLPDVHTESGIRIDKNLMIRGLGRDVTVLQAAPDLISAFDRVIEVRQGASVFIEDLTLRHGKAALGGGIFADGAPGFTTDLTLERVRIAGNEATSEGGGLLANFDSVVRVFDSVIENNEAPLGGGLCSTGGDLMIIGSLIRDNRADRGGGICLGNGELRLWNSTVVDNTAIFEGGGVFAPTGVPIIRHATIVSNAAPTVGGISFLAASVSNTVIANNPGGDCDGPISGAGPRNWDSDGSCGGPSLVGSGDPELDPLRDNGGLTLTMAPREDSPLLDAGQAGDCFVADQRGLDRALGGDCDIGAYERYAIETCASPMAAIPDDDLAGFAQTVVLNAPVGAFDRVIDVNASLWANHGWVGDLRVLLDHDGVTVPLIDRPGVPASGFGCNGDNILASLDDGATVAAEAVCDGGAFALSGRLRPNGRLADFDARSGSGEWRFSISDLAPDFTGTLLGWCVHVELFDEAPGGIFADGFEAGDLDAWTATAP